MSNFSIKSLDNLVSMQMVPFIVGKFINNFTIVNFQGSELNNVYFLDTSGITVLKITNLDLFSISKNDTSFVEPLNSAVVNIDAYFSILNSIHIKNVQIHLALLAFETLESKKSSIKIRNSSFRSNTLSVGSKTRKNTAIIVIQGSIDGSVLFDNLTFSRNTLQINEIPPSGFYFAPNIVVRSQEVKMVLKNSIFEENQIKVEFQSFGLEEASLFGFSYLFGQNLWFFVQKAEITNCSFVSLLV